MTHKALHKSLLTVTIAAVLLVSLAAAQTTPEPAPPVLKQRATAPRAQTPVPPEPPQPPEPPRAMTMVMGSGSYLGVDTREITSDRVSALKLKEERGVEITLVDQDAPAGKAGLKPHDVILTFNGQNVESQEQLRRLIRETPSGRTVELGISREGQPMTIKVQLADRRRVVAHAPRAEREFKFVMPRIPDMDFDIPVMMTLSRRNGITVENLTPQLREFFGVKADEGILVRSVDKGSSGDSAGLKAGDVIVRVGNERVNDVGDWNRLLRRQKGTASVAIVRDRREQTISIKIPERRSEDSSEMRFEFPDFQLEMERLQKDLQRIQPQVQKSVEIAQKRLQSDLVNHQQELIRLQREMQRLGPQIQKAVQESQQEVQREMERLQRELRIEVQDEQ